MATDVDNKDWMQGSSPLKGAVLAMLLESPGHPYALAGRLYTRLGPAWPINPTTFYRILEHLQKRGLARLSPEPDPDNPHRVWKTYRATNLTAGAVEDWMRSPLPNEPMGFELCVRVAVAREQDVRYLLELLDARERECLELLKQYAEEHPVERWFGMELELVRKYAVVQLQAMLSWIEVARGSLEEFSAGS